MLLNWCQDSKVNSCILLSIKHQFQSRTSYVYCKTCFQEICYQIQYLADRNTAPYEEKKTDAKVDRSA